MSKPRFITLLPEDGFRWVTKGQNLLITNKNSGLIYKSMRQAGQYVDTKCVSDNISDLFDTAAKLANLCAELDDPAEFWANVGARTSSRWAKLTTGHELYTFSVRVISGRRLFHDAIDFFEEMEIPRAEIPEWYGKRFWGGTDEVVDKFTGAIIRLYGHNSNIREVYYPKWTDDSDNEGSANATSARFFEGTKGVQTSQEDMGIDENTDIGDPMDVEGPIVETGHDTRDEEMEEEDYHMDEGEDYMEEDGDYMEEEDYHMDEGEDYMEEDGDHMEEDKDETSEISGDGTNEPVLGEPMELTLRFH
ncbi:uncharacterized protein GGS25DRAFT_534863 [Hypoxylon fragiforme]|uniref:uncharacterized protein n=1 Tax=Hypoxylon fragiforme TaxID=63214 RepID=UPI0020C637B0|nr:uncharacterized protein GGS25DRAFT_534863 [Hypoxylon fragiforme]KAI2604464.1 hypothetical protein GGS25DRAFT_534863 [Hypoxylon fragiforme]